MIAILRSNPPGRSDLALSRLAGRSFAMLGQVDHHFGREARRFFGHGSSSRLASFPQWDENRAEITSTNDTDLLPGPIDDLIATMLDAALPLERLGLLDTPTKQKPRSRSNSRSTFAT